MNIYWKDNSAAKIRLPGKKQAVDWRFEYGGKNRIIPYVYRFPEGFIFDLLTLLDKTELQLYFEKYKAIEHTLTQAQSRMIESQQPFHPISLAEISFNGECPADGWSCAHRIHAPWQEKDMHLEKEAKAYARYLKGAGCFACCRYYVPMGSKDFSFWQRLRHWLKPTAIHNIELDVLKTDRFLAIEKTFTLNRESDCQEAHFTHPETKTKYTLYFQNMQWNFGKIPVGNNRQIFITQLYYEITPPLPEGSSLYFDGSLQYAEQIEPEPANSSFIPEATASIGIIGGIDGPTSIFISDEDHNTSGNMPVGIHGLPLKYCVAVPSFEEDGAVQIKLDGIEIKWLETKHFSWPSGK